MEQKSLPCDPVKKRKKLSPEEKYAIFMEASRRDVPVGEVLRKWGISESTLNAQKPTPSIVFINDSKSWLFLNASETLPSKG